MRVAMMTREYPPEVYGGAGVHVTELVRHLSRLATVDVHCMGVERPDAHAYGPDPALDATNPALRMLSTDLRMAEGASQADVVHSHTWYTGLAGHVSAALYGIPHVLTAHSLEPRRPWKADQLGGGYRLSSWVERTAVEHAAAVIAVSEGMRADVLDTYPHVDAERVHVVRNGIDTATWRPVDDPYEDGSPLSALGVDPHRPIAVFVGRITEQKGVAHLVAAAHHFDPDIQIVLCAGAPDTPDIGASIATAVGDLAAVRSGVYWIQDMLTQPKVRQILSAATVFICPSIYEPLGIVNLEAMACGCAVVASAVGGIPEVVDDGVTGRLVPYDPADSDGFEAALANAVNTVVGNPASARAMGDAGRRRAIAEFSWDSIAEQTMAIYSSVLTTGR